jgi:hypothetical protein
MTTSIDIANRALILLGGREITSFLEGTNESRLAKNLYQSTRDYVLRAYPWASLKKRKSLAELAEQPVSGFNHQYQLPNDCMRVLEVYGSSKIKSDYWEVNGRAVLTNSKPVSIVYLSGDVPEQEYSPQLIQALVYRLAAEMAYPMTGNTSAQGNFASLFSQVLDEARTTDALEQSQRPIGPHNFERVRM